MPDPHTLYAAWIVFLSGVAMSMATVIYFIRKRNDK